MKKRVLLVLLLTILLTSCCAKSEFERYKKDYAFKYKINPGYYEVDINNYIDWDTIKNPNDSDAYYCTDKVLKANIKGYVPIVDSVYTNLVTCQLLYFEELMMTYDVDMYGFGRTKGYIKTNKNSTIIVDENKKHFKKNIYLSGDHDLIQYSIPILIEHPNEIGAIKYLADKKVYNTQYYLDDNLLEYSYQLDRYSYIDFMELDHVSDRFIEMSIDPLFLHDYIYTHTFRATFEKNVLTSYKTSIKYNHRYSNKVKSILEITCKKIEPFDIIVDEDVSDVVDSLDFEYTYIYSLYNSLYFDYENIKHELYHKGK